MGKNFIILLGITFLVGIIFKYFFSFREFESNVIDNDIILNLAELNILFYDDPNSNFDEILKNHLHKLEKYLLNGNYDAPLSKSYALGSLYYLRYKEYIAARNLLSEVNQNLYFNPRSNKHGKKIPILNKWINKTELMINQQREYLNYQDKVSSNYSNYKLINSDYFNMNPSDSIIIEDSEQGSLIIYNPYFYNRKAKKSFKKSIDHFTNFLMNYNENDAFSLEAKVKLELLNMYNDDNSGAKIMMNNQLMYDHIIKLLNSDLSQFQIDLIDFLIQLENHRILSIDAAKKMYKKIDYKPIKVLYKLKRKLFRLNDFNNRKIKNIECDDFDDSIFPSELYIAESELILRNGIEKINEGNTDWVDMADSKINDFWTKCIGVFHEIDMEEVCNGCLQYNNYDYTLLTSFRLGMWHGGELPVWSGRFNRVYTKSHAEDVVDPSFLRLRDQIDLWMGAIIK